MKPLPYYRGLDAVRGGAVLMVVFFHSSLFPFGWVGVQIFFVLSGFLITGILRTQVDRPFPVFIGRFYWRRALRIWPLYFLLLALCALAYALFGAPESWNAAWPWLATFTYNLTAAIRGFPGSGYFGHFWTLSVEEQFYLVWPLVVFCLSLRRLRQFAGLLIVTGPLWRYLIGRYLASHFDDPADIRWAAHNLPMSHLDAFASGALLAVLPDEWRARWSPQAVPVFFAVLTVTLAVGMAHALVVWRHGFDPHWFSLGYGALEHFGQYVWAYSLLNAVSVCLIFCAVQETVPSLLRTRALVYLGTISYGLYLWHLPLREIFALLLPGEAHGLTGLIRFALYLAASVGIASLSYFGFERFFLRLKSFRPRATLASPLAKAPTTENL